MSFKNVKNIGSGATAIRNQKNTGMVVLELSPPVWELCKRRTESFIQPVLAHFNPDCLREKSCVTLFGLGAGRKNEVAMKYWLVTQYQDSLCSEATNVQEIADDAFDRMTRLMRETGGFWQPAE
jgi:hypothetical protein